MGIPVATVSRRVADLESSLDVRLLERSTRKLRLTDAGATLYEYATRGVEEMDAGRLALLEQEQQLKGRLRLSMPPTYEPMWKLLDRFQASYPAIDIDLFVSERQVDFIEDGIDVALRIRDPASVSINARKLVTYRHRLVASPQFLRGCSINTPQDVLSNPCAAWYRKGQVLTWTLGEETLNIEPFLRANDYLHMRYLALNDKCITELPPFFCQQHLERGELVELLPDYPMPQQQVHLAFPSSNRIARVFIDYCVKEAASLFRYES